jgi:2-polyprenyl-6-methoxyphenol hydroxylase-like FAD-dependent oxidoreductase
MRVAIAGGGVAGLTAGLALARAGHEVTVVERDPVARLGGPEAAFDWQRPGAAQFNHPHVLLARACNELLDHAPDVYAHLVAAGATEIPVSHPDARPDPELRALGVRRPLLEWALRRAIADEPDVHMRHDSVRDLAYDADREGATVRGLVTDSAHIPADLVVDALGRNSPLPARLRRLAVRHGEVAGPVVEPVMTGDAAAEAASGVPCGMAYLSRFYRLRPGHPHRPSHLAVPARAEFGYASAILFWADSRHMGLVVFIPAGDRRLRAFGTEKAFDEIVASSPLLGDFVGGERAEPVTGVRLMGQLRAAWRPPVGDSGRLPARRVVTVGDAYCHTNPLYGWGVSMAFAQAFALSEVLANAPDIVEAQAAYAHRTGAEAADRHGWGVGMDRLHGRLWRGEAVDFLSAQAEPVAFRVRAIGLAAAAIPQVHQRYSRWIGCLDPSAALDSDDEFKNTVVAAARMVLARTPRQALPTRDELLARCAG